MKLLSRNESNTCDIMSLKLHVCASITGNGKSIDCKHLYDVFPGKLNKIPRVGNTVPKGCLHGLVSLSVLVNLP